MTDPRSDIPDTVLTAPDGTLWLARSRQLAITADRDAPIQIALENQIQPVSRMDGTRAVTFPNATAIGRSFSVDLATVPNYLAGPLALWMSEQAGVNGQVILDSVYPPAPQIEPEAAP